MIAEVKDSIGTLVAPNQIVYSDAFTDILADYRITLSKAGVEADVILRQQLPSPSEYGLAPETTHLEVELTNGPSQFVDDTAFNSPIHYFRTAEL